MDTGSQLIFAGLVSGVIFGAITAVGALIAVHLLPLMHHVLEFEGRRFVRVVKFVTFGVLFGIFGAILGPVALGMWVAWGIGNDSSSPPAVDTAFYVGYFGTIAFYTMFWIASTFKRRGGTSQDPR